MAKTTCCYVLVDHIAPKHNTIHSFADASESKCRSANSISSTSTAWSTSW